MKLDRRFLIAIGVFLLLVLLLEWNVPSRFVWSPTYRHADTQPFGCQVMDSLLGGSLPKGYRVCSLTLPQLNRQPSKQPQVIIVQARRFMPTETDGDALNALLRRGNRVVIVAESATINPDSTIMCSIYGRLTFFPQVDMITSNAEPVSYDTLEWQPGRSLPARSYRVLASMNQSRVAYPDSDKKWTTWLTTQEAFSYAEPVAEDDTVAAADTITEEGEMTTEEAVHSGTAIIASRPVGRGELVLCAAPWAFTNYGMMDDDGRALVMRVLSEYRDMPVVRTEAYLPKTEARQQTPLRYFLEQPPLRWATYTAVLLLLLFFAFTARRRQRVIPVVNAPDNPNLAFVRQIGSLYWQRHNHNDLLRKALALFADDVRRHIGFDMDEDGIDETAERLSVYIGVPAEEVKRRIRTATKLSADGVKVSNKELRSAIDGLDDMIRKLTT